MQSASGLHAVQEGHFPIHQHQTVGIALIPGALHPGQGLIAVVHPVAPGAQLAQEQGDVLTALQIVIGHQSPQLSVLLPRRCTGTLHTLEGNVDKEGAPLPQGTAQPDPAPHHLHKAFADGKAQAGPAILVGHSGALLFKGLKDLSKVLFRDSAPSVLHFKADLLGLDIALQQLHTQSNLSATRCEFQRV